MKKVVFFSILTLILVLINSWLDRGGDRHLRLQYDEAFHPKVNADMVIFGASHAAHGINPKYLERDGLKVFNFAQDGAGPLYFLKWYRKIFQRYYRKPDTVIYGVHWAMFGENLGRKLENDSMYFPRDFLFKEFRDLKTMTSLIMNRIPLIRYRKILIYRLLRLLDKLQKSKRRTQTYYVQTSYYNGFVPYERKGRLDRVKSSKPKITKANISAFEDLLDEFKKDKVEVIFVHIPGNLASHDPSHIQEGLQLLNEIAEKRKILFLDYEAERITNINTDPTMFSDWIHLNEKGSVAFSKLLRSDLDSLLKQRTAKD
jgi:hypothetical protein